jgi:AcrR family transcriptional regulator
MGRPQTFVVEDLIDAGLALVTDEGWASMSFRSIADRLRVSPMALYRVVPDAEQLRATIANAAARRIQPPPDLEDPITTLRVWAKHAYRHLRCYPGLAAYIIHHWTELDGWLDIVEALLERAAASGLTGREAVEAVNAVFAYVLVRAQLRDSIASAPRRRLGPVRDQRERYPTILANLAEFTTAKTEQHFAAGLTALTTGLDTTWFGGRTTASRG